MRGPLNPLDGRYAHITAPLAELFSERTLMHERVNIELELDFSSLFFFVFKTLLGI